MPRKTRKQKERAAQKRESEAARPQTVKGEFEFSFTSPPRLGGDDYKNKKSDKSFYFYESGTTARDLVKTLVLATLIFSLEIMIYFAWFKETGPGYQIYNLINGQFKQLF